MAIIYEFDEKNFNASAGDTRIVVADGRLELERQPDPATLALIEAHGGRLVSRQTPQRAKSQRTVKNDSNSS